MKLPIAGSVAVVVAVVVVSLVVVVVIGIGIWTSNNPCHFLHTHGAFCILFFSCFCHLLSTAGVVVFVLWLAADLCLNGNEVI